VLPKASVTEYLGNTRQVQWKAPALNTVMLRYTADTVRTILIYGRANTPMPAWGVAGGGAMNEQQILDLVEYLKSITLSPEKAINRSPVNAAKLFERFLCHRRLILCLQHQAPMSGSECDCTPLSASCEIIRSR